MSDLLTSLLAFEKKKRKKKKETERKFLMGMYRLHSREKKKREKGKRRENAREGEGLEKVPERELEKCLGKVETRAECIGSGEVIFALAAAKTF